MSSNHRLEWQVIMGDSAQQDPHAGEAGPTKATAPNHPPAGISAWGKKSVLLVDANGQSRESRAKVMRTLGVRVDCAASADTARVKLAAEKYNLILVDLGRNVAAAESFVREIRTKNCRQLVGFLVGRPLFVAQTLARKSAKPVSMVVRPAAEPVRPPQPPQTEFGKKIRDAECEQEKLAS